MPETIGHGGVSYQTGFSDCSRADLWSVAASFKQLIWDGRFLSDHEH